ISSPGQCPPASGTPPTLELYRNLDVKKFEDVTERVGLAVTLFGMGVAVGDYDNDGRPDVFVSCVGKHRLFRNVDGKRFEDVTDAAGVGGPGEWPKLTREQFLARKEPIPFGSSCTFLDYDGDGRPPPGGQGPRRGGVRPGRRRLAGPRRGQRHGPELLLPQPAWPERHAGVQGGRLPDRGGLRRRGAAPRRDGDRLGRVRPRPLR